MPTSQYQHYIPRFILRNFALDDHLKHSKERHDIYCFNVNERRLHITDVDTSYGMTNMYADIRNTADINYLETEISHLEQKASSIIQRCTDLSETRIVLSLLELETLQRFLFVMSFRFPARRSQFEGGSLNEVGLREVQEFMRRKGRSETIEAWLENIKGALREDPGKLLQSSDIMQTHGTDYWARNKFSFICIWEAEEPDEFILTENGFGLWEGECGNFFTEHAYHYFYRISPRRILVHAKVYFKPQARDGLIGKEYRAIANKLGLGPKGSIFPAEIHKDPVVNYIGTRLSTQVHNGSS